jgi:hypothetical protein
LVSGRSDFAGGRVRFVCGGFDAGPCFDFDAQSLDFDAQGLDFDAQSLDPGVPCFDSAPGYFYSENAGSESPSATDCASHGAEAVRADTGSYFPAPGEIA